MAGLNIERSPVGNALNITGENFEEEVLKSELPVLVDFTASWCAPCQELNPIIEDLAAEYRGRVKVGKLDVDQGMEIANRYGVMSVPTVIAFRGGMPQEIISGVQPKSYFRERLDAFAGQPG